MTELTPYWWLDAKPSARDENSLPSTTDVLIIGAGHTGLSAARTFAKAGVSVCVIDADAPGAAASTRNGGMVGGGHRQGLQELQKLFGHDIAVQMLREAHKDSGAFVQDIIHTENIACDYTPCGRFRGFWHTQDYDATARSIAELQKLFPLNAEMIARADQHLATASPLYRGGVIFHNHGGFHPLKFHQGLMQAAERVGARMLGHCTAEAIARQAGHYRVSTTRGEIQAEKILLATNGYTGGLVPDVQRGIFPIPSFIIATEPLPREQMQQLFPKGRMMVETRVRHCYYRPSPDGRRILLGGRAALVPKDPRYTQRQLEKLLQQIFPDLGQVEISHHWRGNTGFTFDQSPHIGVINNIGYALGYSGNGNTMAPYLGHKIALQMLDSPEGDTAFSHAKMPTRWWHLPNGKNSPWFMHFADPLYRLLDIKENWRR